MRCPSDMPRSTRISCRAFSLTTFSPLHFLHLQDSSTEYSSPRYNTYRSFSRRISPVPWQSVHGARVVAMRTVETCCYHELEIGLRVQKKNLPENRHASSLCPHMSHIFLPFHSPSP